MSRLSDALDSLSNINWFWKSEVKPVEPIDDVTTAAGVIRGSLEHIKEEKRLKALIMVVEEDFDKTIYKIRPRGISRKKVVA